MACVINKIECTTNALRGCDAANFSVMTFHLAAVESLATPDGKSLVYGLVWSGLWLKGFLQCPAVVHSIKADVQKISGQTITE